MNASPKVKITYRQVEPSEALSRLILAEAAKLDRFYDHLLNCDVLIEYEEHHLRHGSPFRVRIALSVPGDELTVDTAATLHELLDENEIALRHKSTEINAQYKDPALAVRDAFRMARRRVQDYARRMKGPHVRSSLR